jgi:TonB family protein
MMTLLNALDVLGQATLHTLWVPMLAWTLLAVPLWWGLEQAEQLHPLTTYRLHQTILAGLPLGLLTAALFDGPVLSDSLGPLIQLPAVSVGEASQLAAGSVVDGAAAPASAWQWTQAVGLATVAAGGSALVALVRLSLDAGAALRVRTEVAGRSVSPHLRSALPPHTAPPRGARIRTHPDAEVPSTLGGLRPLILLPPDVAEDRAYLRMTLAHECVHLRRYDDLAQGLERLVTAVFAIHPLVGRLQNDLAQARERACDAAVLTDNKTTPADYARLLAHFATGSAPPTGTLSLSESSSLLNRLRAMQSSSALTPTSPFTLAGSVIGLGLVLLIGIACADSTVSPVDDAPESSAAAAQTSTDTTFSVVDEPPKMKGGLQALQDDISYPTLAKDAGISGRVLVQFVVDTNGEVVSAGVVKSPDSVLNSAALDAVRAQTFEPGRKDGAAVRVQMALPITFQLPASSEQTSGDLSPDMTSRSDAAIADRIQRAFTRVRYPALLQKAGVEGRVVVRFTVTPSGDVTDVRVADGAHDALNAAARQAVQDLQLDATGASTDVTLPIRFSHSEEAGAEIRFKVLEG